MGFKVKYFNEATSDMLTILSMIVKKIIQQSLVMINARTTKKTFQPWILIRTVAFQQLDFRFHFEQKDGPTHQ